MNKTSNVRKKRVSYDSYNKEALLKLREKYGVSNSYIHKSITGLRTGMLPEKIKIHYRELVKAYAFATAKVDQKMGL